MLVEPTDLQLCEFATGTYGYKGDPVIAWDYQDFGTDDGVHAAFKHCDGYDVLACRGTVGPLEWIHDFMFAPISTKIGTVESGFYLGVPKMAAEIASLVTQPLYITGHSLGASHADLLTGELMTMGIVARRRVVFGEPRPGFPDFADFIKAVPADSYRNGDGRGHVDIVTTVPYEIRDLALDYEQPKPLIDVTAIPTAAMVRAWNIASFHHIWLYREALGGPSPPPDSMGD